MTGMTASASTDERRDAEGRVGYFADFAVYAIVLVALVTVGVSGQAGSRSQWLGAAVGGAAAWTLIEYVLHRFVFHQVPAIAAIHFIHHRLPRSYLWTPTWASLAVLTGVFLLPLWRWASPTAALGVVTGIVAGYLWYGIEHHIIHHGRPRWVATALRGAGRRHALHHGSSNSGNFGVTTSVWDVAFATALTDRARRPDRESAVEP